ncbi:MAG TPA: 3'-5' exonuclease, partial [Candidatus Bathyarchaeia archaeon]|nr:3'-5' exonuclease [Candidatus Bathyarchaeia archaeon]
MEAVTGVDKGKMASKTLKDYFSSPSTPQNPEKELPKEIDRHKPATRLEPESHVPRNLTESYLIGAGYDGAKSKAFLKLYEPKSQRIFIWYDDTGHRPYCFSDLSPEEIEKIAGIKSLSGLDHLEQVKLCDAMKDQEVLMTKVVAKDPLTIGGRMGGQSVREILPRAWEADIRYYENFIYDRDLTPGNPYRIEKGRLITVEPELPATMSKSLMEPFKDEAKELRDIILKWIDLFESPIPEFRRVALDIEVFSPVAARVPDPSEANHEVIAATLYGSDGLRKV